MPAEHARILGATLPRSETILFDECGHVPQIEGAREFNAAVLSFLNDEAK